MAAILKCNVYFLLEIGSGQIVRKFCKTKIIFSITIRFQVLDPMAPDPPMPNKTSKTTAEPDPNPESNDNQPVPIESTDADELVRLDDEEEIKKILLIQ